MNVNIFDFLFAEGYNIQKTLLYGFAFAFFAILTYKIVKKAKIKIDDRFAIAIVPFVIFSGIVRVLSDAKIINGFLFSTPGVALISYFIFLSVLFFARTIEKLKKIPYYKISFLIGIFLISFSLPFLSITNANGLLFVLAFFAPWTMIFMLIRWTLENKLVSLIHLFDANTTFVAIHFFGYAEQHILPSFVIQRSFPFAFIPLKLIVIVFILILIDRHIKEKQLVNFLKLAIGLFGCATASRDLLRILCHV